mmetsp:Transcript_142247/g.354467  ORF Transcript_142247/g.354467 Transcript_142247/m.354467 type:complete len:217 (-) Transcript_142247:5116-5766(-)
MHRQRRPLRLEQRLRLRELLLLFGVLQGRGGCRARGRHAVHPRHGPPLVEELEEHREREDEDAGREARGDELAGRAVADEGVGMQHRGDGLRGQPRHHDAPNPLLPRELPVLDDQADDQVISPERVGQRAQQLVQRIRRVHHALLALVDGHLVELLLVDVDAKASGRQACEDQDQQRADSGRRRPILFDEELRALGEGLEGLDLLWQVIDEDDEAL